MASSNGTYTKTFRIDPRDGTVFEACDRPGEGEAICSLYGSQMPHTVIGRRLRRDGWEGRRFTKTEWAAGHEGWEDVTSLLIHGRR